MAKRITFIHAADLHIGAPLRGLREVSPEWGDRLLSAIAQAYARMIDAAVGNNVDFVVLAGDVFDQARPTYADQLRFLDGLERLNDEGIPVYCIPGNHDPFVEWQGFYTRFPENIHMISNDGPGYALYERNGEPLCIVMGRGYYEKRFPESESMVAGLSRRDAVRALGARAERAPFAVGVMHIALDSDKKDKAAVPREQLLATDIDYWALGHIHAPYRYPEDNPRICFSGVIQGRDIQETGPRGVNLVTLEEGRRNKVEFVPTASVVWQQAQLDVSACETLSDVEDQATQCLFGMVEEAPCDDVCARIALVGVSKLREALRQPGVLQDMRASINCQSDHFYCDALTEDMRLPRDIDAIYKAALFPAEVIDACDDMHDDPQGTIDFLQRELRRRGLRMPRSMKRDLGGLIVDAQDIALDLLMEGER